MAVTASRTALNIANSPISEAGKPIAAAAKPFFSNAPAAQIGTPIIQRASYPATPIEEIPPPPIRRHHIPDETAARLATLPRNRWDEMTWGAFGGAVAAFPSAIDAVKTAALKDKGFSLDLFGEVQVLIFVVFFVWFVVRKLSSRGETSGDLLKELRKGIASDKDGQIRE